MTQLEREAAAGKSRGMPATGPDADKGLQPTPAEEPVAESSWLCRGPGILRRVSAAFFAVGCVGAAAVFCIYHWPRAAPWNCFFTIWPAFAWFLMALASLLLGVFGVRWRWFLCGCVVWLAALTATEDIVQCLKVFPSGDTGFKSARFALCSYLENGGAVKEGMSFPLRIVTCNMGLGRIGSPDAAVQRLAELDADMIFLQEYAGRHFDESIRRSPVLSRYYSLRDGRNVLLSRYRIMPARNGPRRPGRSVVYYVQLAPGIRLTCINVHLGRFLLQPRPLLRSWSAERVAAGVKRTNASLNRLRELIEFYDDEPAILAGDFNLPERYPGLSAATVGLKDCFAVNGYGWGKTAPAELPVLRIDRVFVPRSARVFSAWALPTSFSDHRMVMAEVAVQLRKREIAGAPLKQRGLASSARH